MNLDLYIKLGVMVEKYIKGVLEIHKWQRIEFNGVHFFPTQGKYQIDFHCECPICT